MGISPAALIGGGVSIAVLGGLTGALIGSSVHATNESKGSDGMKGAGIFAVGAMSAGIGIGGALWGATDVFDALRAAGHSTGIAQGAGAGVFLAGTAAYVAAGIGAGMLTHALLSD